MRVAGLVFALTLAGLTVWPGTSSGQSIVADPSMGTSVANGGPSYTITGGTVRGSSLFHSFQSFNVFSGELATFQGDPSTANVLSRVTGGAMSTIDGGIDIRSAMPVANFFFINPGGVVFGPGAFLDVGGSIRISTADSIIFPDGQFFASLSETSVLSSEPPQAFGFLGSNPATITLNGAVLFVDPPADPSLPGQTLSLVGGDVQLLGGAIAAAPGGLVQIVSVGSPGTVDLSAPNVAGFTRLGTVTISEGSILAGTDPDFFFPGGTVLIRGGQLIVEGGATLLSATTDFPAAATGIDLYAREAMTVRDAGTLVQALSLGGENGSSISIEAGHLTVSTGALIESAAFATGNGGRMDVRVGTADIASGGAIKTNSLASSAGNISIAASGTITLSGAQSEISSGTFGTADPLLFGGDISVSAADLVLRDQARIRSGSVQEQAGQRVSINATNAVSISSRAGISSQSFEQGAGAIDISAQRVVMDAGFINTSTLGAGAAGQVLVNANTVSLVNGAQIASSSQIVALGAAGSISVNAPGSVAISGIAAGVGVGDLTFTGSASSGLFSATEGTGNAGQISVSTPALTLADGGRILVTTEGAGNAGTILANVGNFSITSGGRVDSSTSAGGAGGDITVNGALTIAGAGSGLFSTASSTGDAGVVSVTGPNVTVGGGGTIDSSTTGAGAGGAIGVTAAGQVEIANGGSVRADSLGSGFTGNITISAGDRIVMENGSISTRAVSSDGGNITLRAPNVIKLGNSQITTSVESGSGGGGNIFIDPQFVILNGSTITANAFGGPGGSITIVADNFLTDPSSFLSASSALSTPGTVTIESPENNLAGSIAQLPKEPVDASRLLRGGCSARRTGAPSSFTLAGRGGVPPDADAYQPSFSATGVPFARAAGGADRGPGFTLAMAQWDCMR